MDNGFKKSGIRMNQWIGQQDNWTEAELVERNNILVQRALEIWEYPSTDYKAPEKLLDMVSLENDAYLQDAILQSTRSWVSKLRLQAGQICISR